MSSWNAISSNTNKRSFRCISLILFFSVCAIFLIGRLSSPSPLSSRTVMITTGGYPNSFPSKDSTFLYQNEKWKGGENKEEEPHHHHEEGKEMLSRSMRMKVVEYVRTPFPLFCNKIQSEKLCIQQPNCILLSPPFQLEIHAAESEERVILGGGKRVAASSSSVFQNNTHKNKSKRDDASDPRLSQSTSNSAAATASSQDGGKGRAIEKEEDGARKVLKKGVVNCSGMLSIFRPVERKTSIMPTSRRDKNRKNDVREAMMQENPDKKEEEEQDLTEESFFCSNLSHVYYRRQKLAHLFGSSSSSLHSFQRSFASHFSNGHQGIYSNTDAQGNDDQEDVSREKKRIKATSIQPSIDRNAFQLYSSWMFPNWWNWSTRPIKAKEEKKNTTQHIFPKMSAFHNEKIENLYELHHVCVTPGAGLLGYMPSTEDSNTLHHPFEGKDETRNYYHPEMAHFRRFLNSIRPLAHPVPESAYLDQPVILMPISNQAPQSAGHMLHRFLSLLKICEVAFPGVPEEELLLIWVQSLDQQRHEEDSLPFFWWKDGEEEKEKEKIPKFPKGGGCQHHRNAACEFYQLFKGKWASIIATLKSEKEEGEGKMRSSSNKETKIITTTKFLANLSINSSFTSSSSRQPVLHATNERVLQAFGRMFQKLFLVRSRIKKNNANDDELRKMLFFPEQEEEREMLIHKKGLTETMVCFKKVIAWQNCFSCHCVNMQHCQENAVERESYSFGLWTSDGSRHGEMLIALRNRVAECFGVNLERTTPDNTVRLTVDIRSHERGIQLLNQRLPKIQQKIQALLQRQEEKGEKKKGSGWGETTSPPSSPEGGKGPEVDDDVVDGPPPEFLVPLPRPFSLQFRFIELRHDFRSYLLTLLLHTDMLIGVHGSGLAFSFLLPRGKSVVMEYTLPHWGCATSTRATTPAQLISSSKDSIYTYQRMSIGAVYKFGRQRCMYNIFTHPLSIQHFIFDLPNDAKKPCHTFTNSSLVYPNHHHHTVNFSSTVKKGKGDHHFCVDFLSHLHARIIHFGLQQVLLAKNRNVMMMADGAAVAMDPQDEVEEERKEILAPFVQLRNWVVMTIIRSVNRSKVSS